MNWHLYFTYDPSTGNLLWKKRLPSESQSQLGANIFNSIYEGKVAGSIMKIGYVGVSISVNKKSVPSYAHRIIWEMHNGPIPEGMVMDHINRVKTDNRIENLRMCTESENNRNKAPRPNTVSGYPGVSKRTDARRTHKKWRARIVVGGKELTVGTFRTPEEAWEARCEAVRAHYGEFGVTEITP